MFDFENTDVIVARQEKRVVNPPTKVSIQNQLPIWPDHKRGVPNALSRCALFRVGSHKTQREYRENRLIASSKNLSVFSNGYELRQDDADVFLQLIHLQRERAFEDGVEFQSTVMLRELTRSVNKVYVDKLKTSLTRMVGTTLTIQNNDGSNGYCGPLVQRFSWMTDKSEPLKRWRVWFDPKILALFDWAAYTQIDWKIRLSLSPLAKWLHLYYSSHKKPLPVKCQTIMELCGSSMAEMKHFRAELKDALVQLKEASFLVSHAIDPQSDLVSVVRCNLKKIAV